MSRKATVMVPGEELRSLGISGWCGNPSVTDGVPSHSRCNGGNRANPGKEFSGCKCWCHYPEERFECGGCGREIAEAPLWPRDEDGEVRYTHFDPKTGYATGEDCDPRAAARYEAGMEPVSGNGDEEIEDEGFSEDDEFAALMAELDEEL